MKILLAAGIFYPDVGGPAIHVRKIAERLIKENYNVTVIAYGDDSDTYQFPFRVRRISRKYPAIIRWLLYSIVLLSESIRSDIIYAFDSTAAGIPALLSAKLLFKPFLIRIGGDPIWEREVEVGRRFMPIEEYYKNKLYLKDKPILFFIIRIVLIFSDRIIIYNSFWKDFFGDYYKINEDKFSIIKNPAFRRENAQKILPDNPIILFAGRFVAYKNLPMVIEVFEKVRNKSGNGELVFVGAGPEKKRIEDIINKSSVKDSIYIKPSLPQEELFELIRKSSVCIGPALSEFNPNFILEAISFGKPVLLNRNNGLSVPLPEMFLFDPLNQKEFEDKLFTILNPEKYISAVSEVDALKLDHSWQDITDMHLSLIRRFIT